MITVKTLKEYLKSIPDDAIITIYEGDDEGINIRYDTRYWWIRATGCSTPDTYTEGFNE